MDDSPQLRRQLNLPLLTLFGLGTMVGAGIYVLVGEILLIAGPLAPSAFLLAALVAGCTALSYGELAKRYPRSAGEAVYVQQAFGWRWLTRLVGWAVVATGLVSSATLANGFAGYLAHFLPSAQAVAPPVFVVLLGLVAAWGIGHTVWLAAIITGLSVLGLLAVIALAWPYTAYLPEVLPSTLPASGQESVAVVLGAFVAFYAFVGFEDMVNVAEETQQPEKIMLPAIIIALAIAATLYLVVAMLAVLANVELDLAGHPAPLAAMVASTGTVWPAIIAVLSMLSVSNSALAQIVMVSRVVYGMADGGNAPAILAKIHPTRQTPIVATALTVAVVGALAAGFPLLALAKATSLVILAVFTVVNVALLRLLLQAGGERRRLWLPSLGALLSVGLILMSITTGLGGH